MLSAATGMVFLPSSLTFADGQFSAQRQPASAESGTARPEEEAGNTGVQQRLNQMYSRFGSSTKSSREVAPALAGSRGQMIAQADSRSKSGASDSGIRQASNEVTQSNGSAEPARLSDVGPTRPAIDTSRTNRAGITLRSTANNSGVRQVSGTTNGQVAQAGSSEVQRKLDELYRKNGREMPSMQMQDLPDANPKQKLPPLPQMQQPQQQSRPVAQNRVSSFFKAISPFKKAENDERPARVEKMSPDLSRQQQMMQQATQPTQGYQNYQPTAAQGASLIPPPPAPPAVDIPQAVAPRLFPPSGNVEVRELPVKNNELPEFRPAVQLPPNTSVKLPDIAAEAKTAIPAAIQQATGLPALADDVSDAPFTGETAVQKPVTKSADPLSDDLSNPFPDGSEAEADGKNPARPKVEAAPPMLPEKETVKEEAAEETPFTGLKLETPATEAAASPAQPPLLPSASKSAAPALPVDDDDDDDKEADSKADNPQAAKLRKIAERAELKGFKGFCPVTLRDDRDLSDARPQFKALFQSKVYHFATEAARDKFEKNPKAYAPVSGGNDVVASKVEGAEIEGSLDHAVWFRDRLYLFSSAKTKAAFEATPSKYATE